MQKLLYKRFLHSRAHMARTSVTSGQDIVHQQWQLDQYEGVETVVSSACAAHSLYREQRCCTRTTWMYNLRNTLISVTVFYLFCLFFVLLVINKSNSTTVFYIEFWLWSDVIPLYAGRCTEYHSAYSEISTESSREECRLVHWYGHDFVCCCPLHLRVPWQ